MKMAELIDLYESERVIGSGRKLMDALAVTGPIRHKGICWTSRVGPGKKCSLMHGGGRKRNIRESTDVDVPGAPGSRLDGHLPPKSLDRALAERFKSYGLALDSGTCTTADRGDMESLVANLEDLAREIRGWPNGPGHS